MNVRTQALSGSEAPAWARETVGFKPLEMIRNGMGLRAVLRVGRVYTDRIGGNKYEVDLAW